MANYSLLAVGFDSEEAMKQAVANRVIHGTNTQSYNIEAATTIGELKHRHEAKMAAFNEENEWQDFWNVFVNGISPDDNRIHDTKRVLRKLHDYATSLSRPTKDDLLSIYGNVETYIDSKRNEFYLSYAVLTPDDLFIPNTKFLIAESEFRSRDESFNKDYYAKFIEPYDDDMTAWLINCHI